MRLLTGLLTALALALGLGSAVAPSGAQGAEIDPAVRAAFLAAAEKSYETAWRKKGGTWDERCDITDQTWIDDDEVSPLADGRYVHKLDVRRGIKRVVRRIGTAVPELVVFDGRKKYVRTPTAVRASLRAHRAPMSPQWVVQARDVRVPSRTEHLPERAALWAEGEWTSLTRSTLPNGGTRFLGSIDKRTDEEGSEDDSTVTSQLDFATDASGRFVRGTQRMQVANEYRTYSRTCTETWSWSRPRIEVARKAGKHPSSKRYNWERRATHWALGTTWEANMMLARGDSKAEVVAWLRDFAFRKDQRLKNGLRFVMPGANTASTKTQPRIAYEIRVRDGKASYRPVR